MTKQSAEIKENFQEISVKPDSQSQPQSLPKAIQPVAKKTITSEFSISAALTKKEEQATEHLTEVKNENLPDHHFSERDLQTEWQSFLSDLLIKDDVVYYAVNTAKLYKKEENVIQILYPSTFVRSEFEKIQADFFNHFKRKVNNYRIEIVYKEDKKLIIKQETNREKFQKYIEINPILKDLDELFKFDLS